MPVNGNRANGLQFLLKIEKLQPSPPAIALNRVQSNIEKCGLHL